MDNKELLDDERIIKELASLKPLEREEVLDGVRRFENDFKLHLLSEAKKQYFRDKAAEFKRNDTSPE